MKKAVWILGSLLDFPATSASCNHAVEIAKGFQSLGYEVTLIPLRISNQPGGPSTGSYRDIAYAYPFRRRNLLSLKYSGWNRIYSIFAINRVCRRIVANADRLELVFCMPMFENAIQPIGDTTKRCGVKAAYYFVEEKKSVQEMRHMTGIINATEYEKAKVEMDGFYQKVFKHFSGVCSITPKLTEFLQPYCQPNTQLITFPNVRHLEPGSQMAMTKPTGPMKSLVYSGRINYNRDEFATLLAAMQQARQHNLPVHLNIYGSGPDSEVAKIKQQIAENALASHVTFHGFVSREALEAAQSEAAAFLLLKADIDQNRYNFPTKLMDYLAIGAPVIMTRIANHLAYFEDGTSACFVDCEDVTGLFETIKWICENEAAALRIAKAAFGVLNEQFNSSKETARILTELDVSP